MFLRIHLGRSFLEESYVTVTKISTKMGSIKFMKPLCVFLCRKDNFFRLCPVTPMTASRKCFSESMISHVRTHDVLVYREGIRVWERGPGWVRGSETLRIHSQNALKTSVRSFYESSSPKRGCILDHIDSDLDRENDPSDFFATIPRRSQTAQAVPKELHGSNEQAVSHAESIDRFFLFLVTFLFGVVIYSSHKIIHTDGSGKFCRPDGYGVNSAPKETDS